MNKFCLGSSYYPEWWNESEWESDFKKMEQLGFNTVRMGEFAWSMFEPEEGKYDFSDMIKVLDIAFKHNIKVIMGTVTAVVPAWLYKKHPEVKGGNIYGHYDFGGRKGQCLSDSVFLDYAKKITEAQAKALGTHPAVIGWQLDNEPGFPFNDFDNNCNIGFRKFLKEKYGTIDRLNDAWFSMLWSNTYTDFDEICIPVNAAEGGWSPEVQLDYRKYFSFTFNRLLSMEAKLIRKNSPGRFIYTNWPGANWSVNCFEGEKYLDYAGWDNYVPQPFGDDYRIQLRASMEHSFDRRLSNGENKFLVAEQKAYADADANPDVIAAQTWLNISHGAFATVFFQWRSPDGGAEQGYDGIIGKDKNYREDTEQVFKKLSENINKIYQYINNAETKSDIAVIYSYENSWGTRGWTVDGFYDEEIFNAYGGFKNELNTNVDICSIDDDFSKYKIMIMPNHRIITDRQAERIKEYVKNGGIIILNTETGTRDETNKTKQLLPPGVFTELCGAYVTGNVSASDYKKHTGESCVKFAEFGTCEVKSTINRIKLTTAKTIGCYTSGRLKDEPAVTINGFGNGFAILYGTDGNDIYFYESLAKVTKKLFDIVPLLNADDGVIISSRNVKNDEYIFAVNMKDSECAVYPEKDYIDLISEEKIRYGFKLKPYQTIVFRK